MSIGLFWFWSNNGVMKHHHMCLHIECFRQVNSNNINDAQRSTGREKGAFLYSKYQKAKYFIQSQHGLWFVLVKILIKETMQKSSSLILFFLMDAFRMHFRASFPFSLWFCYLHPWHTKKVNRIKNLCTKKQNVTKTRNVRYGTR